jgi:hypothetical protein
MDRRERTIMAAAREGNFELSRQALVQRIAKQMERHGLGIRSHVEHFALAHTGQVTRRDVSHRICAGLPSGEIDFSQLAHDRRDIVQQGKMQLDVLPSGDVADTGRVVIGNLGDPT